MNNRRAGQANRIYRRRHLHYLQAHGTRSTSSEGTSRVVAVGVITTAGIQTTNWSVRLTATNATGSNTKTSTNYIAVSG